MTSDPPHWKTYKYEFLHLHRSARDADPLNSGYYLHTVEYVDSHIVNWSLSDLQLAHCGSLYAKWWRNLNRRRALQVIFLVSASAALFVSKHSREWSALLAAAVVLGAAVNLLRVWWVDKCKEREQAWRAVEQRLRSRMDQLRQAEVGK